MNYKFRAFLEFRISIKSIVKDKNDFCRGKCHLVISAKSLVFHDQTKILLFRHPDLSIDPSLLIKQLFFLLSKHPRFQIDITKSGSS